MNPSQTMVMWTATQQLFSLLDAQPLLAGVKVLLTANPGDAKRMETIWLDGLESHVDVDEMGGRLVRNDLFDVTVMVQVKGTRELAVWERLAAIAIGVDETTIAYPNLDAHPGVWSATVTRRRLRVPVINDGPVGFAELTVEVKTHLS